MMSLGPVFLFVNNVSVGEQETESLSLALWEAVALDSHLLISLSQL